MDSNATSASGLITSLEAMIQASVNSILDRRLGLTGDTLCTQIQTAIATALDKRLDSIVESLGNRMTSSIEQHLANAVGTLNFQVNKSITAALEQRLGPIGSTLTAQITFTAAPLPVSSAAVSPMAQASGMVNAMKDTDVTFQAEDELGEAQSIGNCVDTEKEQPTRKESQKIGESPEKEQPARKHRPAKQPLDIRPIVEDQPVKKQDATGPEDFNTTSPESGDELSLATTISAEGNGSTSNETSASQSGDSRRAVYPAFDDGQSKSKGGPSVISTVQPISKPAGPSSGADKTSAKRRANQKDDAGESELSSSEEESDNEKPKRKRAKVKLDPPGYTDGPSIKFRRVSPKLTASAKNRGYPRVIDLKGFTEASNKQNLTMADVVATVLFNYDPLSLHAFMDMDQYPTFHFVRKESDRNIRCFVIERHREPYGVVVKVCKLQLIVERTALMQQGSAGITLLRSIVPSTAMMLVACGRPNSNI